MDGDPPSQCSTSDGSSDGGSSDGSSSDGGSSDGGSSDGGSSDGGSSDGGGSGLGFFEQCSAAEECTSGICEQGICQGQFGEECTSNDSCYSESCEDSACTAVIKMKSALSPQTANQTLFVESLRWHGVLTSVSAPPLLADCTTDTDCRGAVCLETICSVYIPGS